MTMKLLVLVLCLAAPLAAVAAAANPLECTPQVRASSKADDVLFNDLLSAPGGVGFAADVAFPKAAPGRHDSAIQAIVPYTGKLRGLERWTIRHDSGETAAFLVLLIPDGKGGTNFQISRDRSDHTSGTRPAQAVRPPPREGDPRVRISFLGRDYVWTSTQDQQRFFTPAGLANKDAWTERIVVSPDPGLTSIDALHQVVTAIMGVLQRSKATILTAHPVLRGEGTDGSKAPCYFIAGVMGSPEGIEADFTRFELTHGKGIIVNFQRRLLGANQSQAMSAWLKENGRTTELALLNGDQFGASGALAGAY